MMKQAEGVLLIQKDGSSKPLDLEAGRRAFIKSIGLTVAGAAVFGSTTGLINAPEAQAVGITDADILNFALNLEYLEAEFYLRAAFGRGLSDADITGTGTLGGVSGGRQVLFVDRNIKNYATEIAGDEENHVKFLRAALGDAKVARPAIDINNAFTTAARAAGVIGPGETFDPYANDTNFLLGAFIFEDVGVTAYKGAAPLIQSKAILVAAAGLLAVEAYHAGEIRTILYAKGAFEPVAKISNLRNALGGPGLDQGIGDATVANIVPADANSLAFSRSPKQVLNIVYGNPDTTPGLFFPAGTNGLVR